MDWKSIIKKIIKAVFACLVTVILIYVTFLAVVVLLLVTPPDDFYSCILFVGAILVFIVDVGFLSGLIKKKTFYIPLCVALGLCIIVGCSFTAYQNHIDNIPTVSENDNLLWSYEPYAENSKAVTLDEESELLITKNLPVMDGATALYPIYSAFAKAVYPEEMLTEQNANSTHVDKDNYLKCSTTTNAYKNIVTGEADIIFAALPSEEQEQFAKENGVELVYTPIGKEAFVVFVNAENPIDDITFDEIQKIYSGEITKWSELGASKLGKIRAFQRDEGSGSQSTLEKIMGEKELMIPPKEDVVDGMGGIIERTADYKNFKNAIGYSFRFYSTEMVNNNHIKLLKVNGIYPSLENIENGTYPIASYFYAVTRSDADENTLKLLEWIKGEQGQKIIEMTGYTPLED